MLYRGWLRRVSPALRYLLRGEMPGSVQTDAARRPTGRPSRKVLPDGERCQQQDLDNWRCSNRHQYRMVKTEVVFNGTSENPEVGEVTRLVCGVHRNMLLGSGWHQSLVPDPREPDNPRRLISV